MKIALVIERLDVARGGRETSTSQLAAALAARGHAVTVLCQDSAWSHPGVTVRPLGRRGLLRRRRLAHFVADLQRQCRSGHYDVVHTTLPVPGANVYQPRSGTMPAQLAASLRRRPALLRPLTAAFAAANLHRRYLARLEAQLVQRSRALLLPVSQLGADEFARFYRRTDNVRVVFNAVESPAPASDDLAHWRQKTRYLLGASPDSTVFLTVAKNFELKGVGELIRAFARWYHRADRPDAYLIVVGRDHVEGYQRHAGLRDIGARVLFAPATPDIARWYAAADAVALLSWYDPCSRVVLEAVRLGIPCLTTAFNGACEILASGAGLVVPSPADSPAVEAALARLHDPAFRASAADACRRVAGSLSIERHVDELLAAYDCAPPLPLEFDHAS